MPKVETRQHGDTATYRVRFRLDQRTRSETFAREKDAAKFAAVVDALGGAHAVSWLESQATRPATTDHTVDSWVRHHIEHLSGVTEGTRVEYLRMWERTFSPIFGAIPLDALNRDTVAKGVTVLSKRLSAKSIANARGLLAAASASATEAGHLTSNPARGVPIPRVRTDDDVRRFLTPDEWARVEDELDPWWVPILKTMIGTGLRLGEVRALHVGDVVPDLPALRIVRAFKAEPGGWVEGPPKSRKSRRTVVIPPEVWPLVAERIAGRPSDAYLFTTQAGGVVYPANLRDRVWRPACERAGLRPVPRLHDLRHSHASWLIAAGVPLPVVQARLGHESITTTVDTYGHLQPDAQLAAAHAASLAFSRPAQITA